jgi:hypothetical protein
MEESEAKWHFIQLRSPRESRSTRFSRETHLLQKLIILIPRIASTNNKHKTFNLPQQGLIMISSSSASRIDSQREPSQDVSQISKHQQQQRSAIPHIEVVNEIQIIVNRKDNQRSLTVTTPSDSKDIKKCISSRSSKTDLTTVTTPTTATMDTTKTVAVKNGRRASRDKDKSESSSSICVCGKILKRVKGLLDKKENKKGEFMVK